MGPALAENKISPDEPELNPLFFALAPPYGWGLKSTPMVNSGVAAIARSTVSSKPFENNPALSR